MIGAPVLLGSVIGLYSWHRSIVREAEQAKVAETRAEVVTELEAQHAIETKKYQERVTELEQRVVDLAKNRAASVQRIEVITKQVESSVAEVKNLSDDAVLVDVREFLARRRTAGTAVNAR